MRGGEMAYMSPKLRNEMLLRVVMCRAARRVVCVRV
jgi:hypothetical protein